MTANVTPEPVAPMVVPRDGFGRPLIIPPGGGTPVPYRRCTRFIDVLEDQYALARWRERQIAVGLATRQDLALAAAVAATDPDANARDLDRICREATEAARASAKATIGTALHALTERLDRGLEVGTVPPQYLPLLAAYQEVTDRLRPLYIERFVVQDDLKIGGTPDRIVSLDGVPGMFIADLKTGASTIEHGMAKVAMQLAVYAHSQLYDPATGGRTPLEGVSLTRGLVIALDASAEKPECHLHWVDIAAGWRGVQLCADVWGWRKDAKRGVAVPEPTRAPSRADSALQNAINAARTVEELGEIWAEAFKAGVWEDIHTALAVERKKIITT